MTTNQMHPLPSPRAQQTKRLGFERTILSTDISGCRMGRSKVGRKETRKQREKGEQNNRKDSVVMMVVVLKCNKKKDTNDAGERVDDHASFANRTPGKEVVYIFMIYSSDEDPSLAPRCRSSCRLRALRPTVSTITAS